MRKGILFFLFEFVLFFSYSQQHEIDSLLNAFKRENVDTSKALTLCELSSAYQIYKPDSALMLAKKAYTISVDEKYLKGQSWALNYMAGAFIRLGNSSSALEYYLKELKIEEKRGRPASMTSVFINMAIVYAGEKDFVNALAYAAKADSIINNNQFKEKEELQLGLFLDKGDFFEKANKLDSALFFTQRCFNLSQKLGDTLYIGNALNNLGNIYLKMGETYQAILHYKQSIPYLEAVNDKSNLTECSLGLAKAYHQYGNIDSSKYYGTQSFKISFENHFLDKALNTSAFLSNLYAQKNQMDSAYLYLETMVAIKDSIQGNEKVKRVQMLTMEEELRQEKLVEQLKKEKENRKESLQLIAIGMMIPIFFLISAYLSKRKVHTKVIQFMGIVSILLLFEYITLLIHPIISEQTNHSPILEIIIFICIAAVITPTHHKIEKMLISRLSNMHKQHLQKNVSINKSGKKIPSSNNNTK